MTITTEDLRKLLDEATPGPWLYGRSYDGPSIFSSGRQHIASSGGIQNGMAGSEANARAIASWPDIAAELITARAKLEAAEKIYRAAKVLTNSGINPPDLCAALAAWEATK